MNADRPLGFMDRRYRSARHDKKAEEFDVAWQQFQATGKPRIYTYFRETTVSTSASNRRDLMSLWDFQNKLDELGHFYTKYESTGDLQKRFRDQLDKLRTDSLL